MFSNALSQFAAHLLSARSFQFPDLILCSSILILLFSGLRSVILLVLLFAIPALREVRGGASFNNDSFCGPFDVRIVW